MRSFSFIVALLFALVSSTVAWPELHLLEARKGGKNNETAVSAKGNGTKSAKGNGTKSAKGNSVNKACSQMAKLTQLTELAANQTKLDAMVAKGKINSTEVDVIKAKAANATTKLTTLTANTTLVSECLIVDAHQKTIGQCKQMKSLTKLASLSTNATAKAAMVSKKQLNDTQVSKLDERIANATTKLQTLMSNTTLTALCAAENQNKGADGSTTSSTGAAAAGSGTAASKSAAMALSVQTLPYVLVPTLAGFFALFL